MWWRAIGPALVLAALGAPPAPAQTVLFADDAEGDLARTWDAALPTHPLIRPWQPSDSSTPKARGPAAHSGRASYWTGSSPQHFGLTEVVQGSSVLTAREPLLVPADGATSIALQSLFLNEEDDAGLVEAASLEGGTPGPWRVVAEFRPRAAALGEVGAAGRCDSTRPAGTAAQGFEPLTGDLSAFRGLPVLLRLRLVLGPENRPTTHPCGWYVDDVVVTTSGTPGEVSRTVAAPGPAAPPPPAAAPSVRLTGAVTSGRRVRVRVRVRNGPVTGARLTLRRGRTRLGTARAAEIGPGVRHVRITARRRLRKGRYLLTLTGRTADGSVVRASRRMRVA